MAQNLQCVIFIFFLLGCGTVLSDPTSAPPGCETVAECSEQLQMGNTPEDKVCSHVEMIDSAIKCFEDFLAKTDCQMTANETARITETVKELKLSQDACKESVTPAKSTCDAAMVKACTDKMKVDQLAIPGVDDVTSMSINASDVNQTSAFCDSVNNGVVCYSAALVNCLEEDTKASVEKMVTAFKASLTQYQCCDLLAIHKCRTSEYTITDSSATKDNCKLLVEDKPCVEKHLKGCQDAAFKARMETDIASQLAVCESKGFAGGSGTAIQPLLALVLASCMAVLSTRRM